MHFGAEDPALVEGLLSALQDLRPDLIVISGDLTQRARERQFRAARRFLERLPAPYLVVPGNHDIPLFDLVRRIFWPRRRYLRHITEDLSPLRVLPGIRVLGLDSTRRKTTGRLTSERLAAVAELAGGRETDLRVLVTHHPLMDKQVAGWLEGLAAAAAAHVDILLAGHQHLSWHRPVKQDPGLGILQVQAGTATSHRLRAREPTNSFNVLRWRDPVLEIEVNTYRHSTFVPDATRRFQRGGQGWQRLSDEAPAARPAG